MQNLQTLVAEFHQKFGHPKASAIDFDALRSKEVSTLRLKLLLEEISEGVAAEAILNSEEEEDSAKSQAVVEIFDALLDVAVITLGTACVYGFKLDSNEATESLLEALAENEGVFTSLQAQYLNLEENLNTLWSYPNTKSYLASAVLRDLQNLLDTCIGMADLIGLPFEAGFVEVMKSNMSKLGEDGKPIYREDGKILKGPNYFKPNLQGILDAHFSTEST